MFTQTGLSCHLGNSRIDMYNPIREKVPALKTFYDNDDDGHDVFLMNVVNHIWPIAIKN